MVLQGILRKVWINYHRSSNTVGQTIAIFQRLLVYYFSALCL